MRRIRYEVRFNRRDNRWCIYRNGTKISWQKKTKKEIVAFAATRCRVHLAIHGLLSELTIKRLDNTIQDKRTYGKDPRKSKG